MSTVAELIDRAQGACPACAADGTLLVKSLSWSQGELFCTGCGRDVTDWPDDFEIEG